MLPSRVGEWPHARAGNAAAAVPAARAHHLESNEGSRTQGRPLEHADGPITV